MPLMEGAQFLPILLGLFVGVLLGLTGAGGGIIAVPLLVFGMGMTVADAGPVALLAVAMAAAFGAVLGLKDRILRYKAAMVMSAAGMLLSPLGLLLAGMIPNRPLAGIFGGVLLYVSTTMYLKAHRELRGLTAADEEVGPPCLLDTTRGKLIWNLRCFRTMLASGALMGFLSGLLGVGGGFVIVPALKKTTNLPMKAIVATSMGVITLVSLGGVVGATLKGVLAWSVAAPFGLGAVTGMLLSRPVAHKISGPRLQQTFAVFAFVVALSMIGKALI